MLRVTLCRKLNADNLDDSAENRSSFDVGDIGSGSMVGFELYIGNAIRQEQVNAPYGSSICILSSKAESAL